MGRGRSPPPTDPPHEEGRRSRSPRRKGTDETDEQADAAEGDLARMASDEELGFLLCATAAAAREAIEAGEAQIEFGGLSAAPEERARCLDLVCGSLADSESHIAGLSWASCGLESADVKRLAGALRTGSGSRVLNFGVSKNPGIEAAVWKDLFEALSENATWLDFADNGLTDAEVAPLIGLLSGREELEKLYLDGNKISDVSALAEALPQSGIQQLDLGDNAIDDAGLGKLVDALPRSVLLILVLGSNPISGAGAELLLESIARTSLDAIYLDNTGADDRCLAALGKALKGSSLSELHLDSTKITDVGARALIPHLADSELSYFDISGNEIGIETTNELEAAIAHNASGEGDEEEVQEEEAAEGAEARNWIQTPIPQRCVPCPPRPFSSEAPPAAEGAAEGGAEASSSVWGNVKGKGKGQA